MVSYQDRMPTEQDPIASAHQCEIRPCLGSQSRLVTQQEKDNRTSWIAAMPGNGSDPKDEAEVEPEDVDVVSV